MRETRGFTGKSCVEESRFLEEFLAKELARQLTAAHGRVGGKTCVIKHLPLCRNA
ncbi:DUF2997 domain-containing protein [Desulforhabdus sp. TSK]|uniref:DUF2997 domain-containing protein n=1 Tax=Desulforhabdus sp. TSK TaxID=2925014 RepID=UPI001FC8C7FD|nr:DUF2997 domain-containing protein [Desulforhabdus sp. TSK]